MTEYRNPTPVVDIIVQRDKHILMIKRKKDGLWAMPGGYVDEGESFEYAAIREAKEETGLDVVLVEQFHTYSHPGRDPRQHNATTVFIARVDSIRSLQAGDDAEDARFMGWFDILELIDAGEVAFDHPKILEDYVRHTTNGVPKHRLFDPMKESVIRK